MVEKILERIEVQRGFIQLPSKRREELIGDMPLPSKTLLNASPAKIDKYGRLWSSFLKNKFSAGTRVEISRTENGFWVELARNDSVGATISSDKVLSIEDMLYFETDSMRIFHDDFLKITAFLTFKAYQV